MRSGNRPNFTTRQKHTRECYVVAKFGADTARIEHEIKEMPYYFADYDTTVHFISQEEMNRSHSGLPHGGSVIHSGVTGWEGEHGQVIEYSLKTGFKPRVHCQRYCGICTCCSSNASCRGNRLQNCFGCASCTAKSSFRGTVA
ncbi:diaminopimelate dehydrogenase [gut metagenome]|uniref:Diaminopimelate dehydrogenase n=1 Tax=gut metagenome TaxID=749906 RepID=J9GL73_9ZZZZ